MAAALEAGAEPAGLKAYRRGTHRTVDPASTLARVAPHLASMGITRIANVTGLDRIGIPVVMVCRPNSRSLAVSQGKGLTLEAAKASGVMEAIELHHAERIDLPLKLGSVRDLAGHHRLADVQALPRPDRTRFHDGAQLLWIEGHDLIADRATWVPYEMVHTNYTLPFPAGSGCFIDHTNGLASGNHLLEAINHGIAEVVERDAVTLWHQLEPVSRDRTGLDLASVDDDACADVLDRLDRAGFDVAVWDVTSDVGIPAFHAVIVDRRRPRAHAGAGCHPSRPVALLRSLTEAVQVRTTYIAGSRDDLAAEAFEAAVAEARGRRARELVGRAATRDFRTVPTYESDRLADDLAWMLESLRAAGIAQVIALDLGRPGPEIAVARVVVPGLEPPHDHPAYVPGPRARAASPS